MGMALKANASALVITHNHPSGNLNASESDKRITSKIKECCELFDIRLLDHIIMAKNSYLSFADEGIL
jgi:DNA repair protein RadC